MGFYYYEQNKMYLLLFYHLAKHFPFVFYSFRQTSDVIVLGATNRKEDLDKALLRPGRFDIEVHVSLCFFHLEKKILL